MGNVWMKIVLISSFRDEMVHILYFNWTLVKYKISIYI